MNTRPLRLGIVGLDGHGPVFAGIINGPTPPVDGMRVVAAMPVPSAMITEDRLRENVEKTRALGIEIVDEPDALAKRADGILILHDDGSRHAELAALFAARGRPLFVDKPLEATAEAARRLVDGCRRAGCPLFSASSLRFSLELQQCLSQDAMRPVVMALASSPYTTRPTMPGWVYYGVHAVEPLYQIMGPGCAEVRCMGGASGPLAVGTWADGRTGIARGCVGMAHDYRFAIWSAGAVAAHVVDGAHIYPELLRRIRDFVRTGRSPVDPAESAEVIAFMVAANRSLEEGSRSVSLAEVG